MKQAKWLAACVVAGVLFSGCEKKKEEPAESQPAEQPKTEAPAAATSAQPPAESPKPEASKSEPAAKPKAGFERDLLRPSALREKAPASYEVKFDTTRGAFTLKVTREWAPIGADRFYTLVKHHFYDGAAFFRVVPGFVVQFGLSSYPPVNAAWKRTELKDDPVTQSNKRGYITFATAGPNTRTTQVFISLKDNSQLDGMGFAPFGVVEGNGMNVVEMMYDQYGDAAGPDQNQIETQGRPYLEKGWPKLDYINSATLVQ